MGPGAAESPGQAGDPSAVALLAPGGGTGGTRLAPPALPAWKPVGVPLPGPPCPGLRWAPSGLAAIYRPGGRSPAPCPGCVGCCLLLPGGSQNVAFRCVQTSLFGLYAVTSVFLSGFFFPFCWQGHLFRLKPPQKIIFKS